MSDALLPYYERELNARQEYRIEFHPGLFLLSTPAWWSRGFYARWI